MKIGILTLTPENYSSSRLKQAIEACGHEAVPIIYIQCDMKISNTGPDVIYHGRSLGDLDAVIPRIGAKFTFYGIALVRQFESMGIYTLNGSNAIARAKDKLRTMQMLVRKNIPIPNTYFSNQPDNSDRLVKAMGGAPLIIKLIEGLQGIGVVLAESNSAARAMIEAFGGVQANIIVQEFIKESQGSDIRCLVLGGKVIATMMRKAAEGEFRANLHRGGSSCQVKITAQEKEMAILAAKEAKLNFAGVDIIRGKDGPKILEINSPPGLEGIERTSEKDLAKQVVKYVCQQSKLVEKSIDL